LFHTLKEKIGRLPEDLVVLPAHYADVSEINSEGIVSARLGELVQKLPEFHFGNEQEFVDAMVAGVATPPAIYGEIIRTNQGLTSPDSAQMMEWELGKNECAAARH
jgi:hypothetical protein